MATMLKGAGFDVVQLRRDLKANDMRRALRDFTDDVPTSLSFIMPDMASRSTAPIISLRSMRLLERDIDAYDEAIPLDRIRCR